MADSRKTGTEQYVEANLGLRIAIGEEDAENRGTWHGGAVKRTERNLRREQRGTQRVKTSDTQHSIDVTFCSNRYAMAPTLLKYITTQFPPTH